MTEQDDVAKYRVLSPWKCQNGAGMSCGIVTGFNISLQSLAQLQS